MKELLAHAKVHFSKRDMSPCGPRKSFSVDTIYGEYGVDVYPSQDTSDPPLVVELGLGRRKDSALAHKIVEKLVDPSRSTFVFEPTRQTRDLRDSVAGQLSAMHRLGIDEYDSVGLSFGGYETLARARAAGTRALHVITFAAVGELTGGPRAYGRAIPGMLRGTAPEGMVDNETKIARIMQAIGENSMWLAGCVSHPRNTLAQLAIICQSNLFKAVRELPLSTRLTMVVGGLDSVAGCAGADEAVRIHAGRAGVHMARRILVNGVSHSLTSESETIGYITQKVLQGEVLDNEMTLVRSPSRMRQLVTAVEALVDPFDDPGLAIAG